MKKIALFIFMVAIMSSIVSCSIPNNSGTSNPLSNNSSNTLSQDSSRITSRGEASENTSLFDTSSQSETSLKNEISSEISDHTSSKLSSEELAAQVKEYFDIIFEKNPDKSESEIIEEFPDEFAAIVSFGEKAFPALDEIANDRESYGIKSAFAHYIKQAIKPELYARVFKSPDGKFAIKAVVDTFINMSSIGEVYYFELIDCKTNTTLIVLKDNYYKFTVQWSPDNRYASIEYGSSFFYITDVIDFQELKTIKLPDAKEVESIVQNKFNNDYNVYSDFFGFTHNQWVDDNKIKINIELSSPPEYEGWYIYDLFEDKIIEENIQKVE